VYVHTSTYRFPGRKKEDLISRLAQHLHTSVSPHYLHNTVVAHPLLDIYINLNYDCHCPRRQVDNSNKPAKTTMELPISKSKQASVSKRRGFLLKPRRSSRAQERQIMSHHQLSPAADATLVAVIPFPSIHLHDTEKEAIDHKNRYKSERKIRSSRLITSVQNTDNLFLPVSSNFKPATTNMIKPATKMLNSSPLIFSKLNLHSPRKTSDEEQSDLVNLKNGNDCKCLGLFATPSNQASFEFHKVPPLVRRVSPLIEFMSSDNVPNKLMLPDDF
jgi:hypothetical protein